MTSPQPPDWQRRFQDLKIKFSRPFIPQPQPLNQVEVQASSFEWAPSLQRSYEQFVAWFSAIPSSGKLFAIAGGGLLTLTLLKTVFQLITSLITLSILGIILYLVYRFWILPKSST
jgi:hypothetical protein